MIPTFSVYTSPMKETEVTSLQDILKTEFKTRALKNPAYSLRAFARDLGVSSGFFSRLVSGKASISEASAKKITHKLGTNSEKLMWIDSVVEAQYAKDKEKKERAKFRVKLYENGVVRKTVPTPKFFEWNWFHFAIRRMTHLAEFKFDEKWMADKLGLPIVKVREAMKNLFMMGGLTVEEGQLKAPNNIVLSLDISQTELRKKMGRDLYEKIEKSALRFDRKNTYHANHYFTLNKEQVQEVIKLINSFEDKVDDLTYRNPIHDELFYLNINFFSLLESEKPK